MWQLVLRAPRLELKSWFTHARLAIESTRACQRAVACGRGVVVQDGVHNLGYSETCVYVGTLVPRHNGGLALEGDAAYMPRLVSRSVLKAVVIPGLCHLSRASKPVQLASVVVTFI